MLKSLLYLWTSFILVSQPGFAGYVVKAAEEDAELKTLGTTLAASKGQESPQGWEIDPYKTVYYSCRGMVQDTNGDAVNFLTPPQVTHKLLEEGGDKILTLQRLPNDEIRCTFERSDYDFEYAWYHYKKEIFLKKKPS